MLNLPSPNAALPLELALLAAPESPAVAAALPAVNVDAARPGFADLLAASAVPPVPVPGEIRPGSDAPASPAEAVEPAPAGEVANGLISIEQPWAFVLVPELASLPAQLAQPVNPLAGQSLPETPTEALPRSGAAAGDAVGRGVAIAGLGGHGPWPLRSASQPRLAGPVVAETPTIVQASEGRPRGWQIGLPSGPAPQALNSPQALNPPQAPVSLQAASSPPTLPGLIVRTITGQPIPYPTPEQPPWFDPFIAPPWFDPANPPPAWSDPTRVQPLWYDPTMLPPAWFDPDRIPAAWFDAVRPSANPAPLVNPISVPAAAATATILPASGVPAPANLPAVAAVESPPPVVPADPDLFPAAPAPQREKAVQLPIRPERFHRVIGADQPVLAERAVPASSLLPPVLAALPLPVNVVSASVSAAAPPAAAAAEPAPNPGLTIASDRLGDVAVQLSGAHDQLQVTMQAQPAAAALIGAEAPRLSQDLAAAGVALAGLSVNGQRADLSGGQRERQRQSARRDGDAPLSAARRLAARSGLNRAASPNTATIDRFA
jgi:Flagellar hook-length control protein FliK